MRTESLGPKAEQSRQAILDAAVQRFAHDGRRGTSIAAIARDADVSRSLAYAYFDDADDLFVAALDQDAAAMVEDVLVPFLTATVIDLEWREHVLAHLLEALEGYPLAHRVLSGLEPGATPHILELPALDRVRAVLAGRLRDGQQVGLVRPELDVDEIGRGVVNIWLTLLLAGTQFGLPAVQPHVASIRAIVEAAVVVSGPS